MCVCVCVCVCVCFAGWLTTSASPPRSRWIPVLLNGPVSHHPPPLPPPRQLWGWRAAERPAGTTTHSPPRLTANVRACRVAAESPELLPRKYLSIRDFLHCGDVYRTRMNRIAHKLILSFMNLFTFCRRPQRLCALCLVCRFADWRPSTEKLTRHILLSQCKNTPPQRRDLCDKSSLCCCNLL